MSGISSQYRIDDPNHRLEGIRNAVNNANLSLPESMIEYATPDQEGGELAMQNLLVTGAKFTAVLAYNDAMAEPTMLQDHGISVPEQVSVMGYDDVLLAKYCRPKLTTLRYPVEMMAAKAAELALKYASEANQKMDLPLNILLR